MSEKLTSKERKSILSTVAFDKQFFNKVRRYTGKDRRKPNKDRRTAINSYVEPNKDRRNKNRRAKDRI